MLLLVVPLLVLRKRGVVMLVVVVVRSGTMGPAGSISAGGTGCRLCRLWTIE